ncbi:hypothetical protein sos41_20390 [Alphaproteobacteria bacterium SO-S41]|nr:hypothetical protein sos41_20390 [Alphaproteobacteria bacterium SO-S41]
MKRFVRTIASAAVAMFVAVGVAPAQDIQVQMLTNRAGGYQIGVPADWAVASPEGLDYVFVAPDHETFCMVMSGAFEPVATMSESELRAGLSQNLGPEIWDSLFFSDVPGRQYITTSAIADYPSGWPVQFAAVNGNPVMDGKPTATTFAGIFTFKKGSIFMVMCAAPKGSFNNAKPGISVVLATLNVTK